MLQWSKQSALHIRVRHVVFVFWTHVYCFNTRWYLDLWMLYIFFDVRILQPFMKMYVFSLGWNLKHWTLLGIQVYNLLPTWFYIYLFVLNLKPIGELSTFSAPKITTKPHLFYFCLTNKWTISGLCMFWSLFGVFIYVSCFSLKLTHLWPSNSLWLPTAFCMHLNYNIIKNTF